MSKYAMFYNSKNNDRVYDADDMTEWLKPFFATGIFNGGMQVTANDNMSVTIAGGYCNIGGKVKKFNEAQTLTIETASGTLNRIDNVILRRDDIERDITLMIQKGGQADTPTAPALTRSGAYYDLKLAEIYVSAGSIKITQDNITDCRANGDVCGWVASTVKEIDFSQMTTQFNAFFEKYKEDIRTSYLAYLTKIGEYENAQKEQFETWFKTIKDILSGNVAGNLQNQINILAANVHELRTYEAELRQDLGSVKTEIENTRLGKNVVLTASKWSAQPETIEGLSLYTYTCKVDKVFSKRPEISLIPQSPTKIPRRREEEAFNSIKAVVLKIDGDNKELIFYTEEKHDTTFVVFVKGVK